MKKICLVIIFTLFAFSVEAKDLYVDGTTGSDAVSYAGNNENNPWLTIGRAAWGSTSRNNPNHSEAAQAGDTVYIASGTYHHSVVNESNTNQPLYSPVNSGSPGNYITFQAVGTVTLTTEIPSQDSYMDGEPVIGTSQGISYVKWDGFTINQANINFRGGNGIINVWGDYTTISNNEIIGIPTTYPWGHDQHNAILAKGIHDDLQTGLVIENNRLHGFSCCSSRNSSAITLYYMSNAEIRNNEIYGNRTGVYSKANNGGTGINIHHNLFRDNTGDGISIIQLAGANIYQNIFRDGHAGFDFKPQLGIFGEQQPLMNQYIVNNVFDNLTYAVYVNDDGCDWLTNNHFKNNIVNATNVVFSEACADTDLDSGEIDFDYNMNYDFTNFGDIIGNNISYSTWQAPPYSQDANSTFGTNPQFVDGTNDDFRLNASSPAMSVGVDILDLDNDGSTTDSIHLGAYITGNEIIGTGAKRPKRPGNPQVTANP